MSAHSGAMHVARNRRANVAKSGERPYRSFRGLLEHLATLTQVRFVGASADVLMLTEPASGQRQASTFSAPRSRSP